MRAIIVLGAVYGTLGLLLAYPIYRDLKAQVQVAPGASLEARIESVELKVDRLEEKLAAILAAKEQK